MQVVQRLRSLLNRWTPSENTLLLVLAVAVGLTTAGGVYVFRQGIDFFQRIYREGLLDGIFHFLGQWAIIPVLALAGLIVGFLMDRFVGEERLHGVAAIMEAVSLVGGRLSYRQMPAKAALSSFSLGAGASVGPEDPSVQIGANLGSMFGQWLRLSDERLRLLVAAGVASGIASAFRAPIAGVFFALEVVLGDLSTGSFGMVVLAAVIASVFTQTIEVGGPELGLRSYSLGGVPELPLYIILGILIAPISAAFIRLLYWQHDVWHHIHLPRPARTMLAGVVVGLIAVFLPAVMGTGRETLNLLLNETGREFPIMMLLALVIGKMLATTISLGGGFVGGMFAPSLFVGAAFGSAFGHLVNAIFPNAVTANPAAYAMVGMAAAMTGVIRAPITAVLLLFELTGDYMLILPIMLVTVVCLFVVERLAPDGIYHHGLARKGVRLVRGRDIDLMQAIAVGEAMTSQPQVVRADLPAEELPKEFRRTNTHGMPVVDSDGRLYGIVTLQDLVQAQETGALAGHTVGEICTRDVLTVTPEEPLSRALQLISARDLGRLPVVDAETGERVIGLLRRRDIVRAYDLAVQRKLEGLYQANQVRLAVSAQRRISELKVKPGAPVDGKMIKEVEWPSGSLVASIRRARQVIVPRGDTVLRRGDWLTVVSTNGDDGQFKKLTEPPATQPAQHM